jgi:hypothetical protein
MKTRKENSLTRIWIPLLGKLCMFIVEKVVPVYGAPQDDD